MSEEKPFMLQCNLSKSRNVSRKYIVSRDLVWTAWYARYRLLLLTSLLSQTPVEVINRNKTGKKIRRRQSSGRRHSPSARSNARKRNRETSSK